MPASATSAVDKALDLIETVTESDRPLRLSEIADRLGMHRATAYRVLLDLVRRGWILRLGEHYLPGPAILRLSRSAAANSLASVARPALEQLAAETDMMVNLQVLAADRSRVIDVVRPDRLAMISDLRDELLPVHRFAGPLALVAALGEDARAPYLRTAEADGYPLDGDGGLLADLHRAERGGLALQRGRNQQLIASISRVVTATDGAPVCALTVVGPDAEFDGDRLPVLERQLRAAVERLRSELSELTEPQPRRTGHA